MIPLSLDMDSNGLAAWIASNGPVHIVFSKAAENFESYPEEGIQAIVTHVNKDNDDCHRWKLDYTPFEVANALRESSTYYDSTPGSPGYLTAYATNFYKCNDHVYVEIKDKISKTISFVQPSCAFYATREAVEQRFEELQKKFEGFSI